MSQAVVLAIAWPAGAGVELLSRAFWLHQAESAVASLVLLCWVAWLGARGAGGPTGKVVRFRPRR